MLGSHRHPWSPHFRRGLGGGEAGRAGSRGGSHSALCLASSSVSRRRRHGGREVGSLSSWSRCRRRRAALGPVSALDRGLVPKPGLRPVRIWLSDAKCGGCGPLPAEQEGAGSRDRPRRRAACNARARVRTASLAVSRSSGAMINAMRPSQLAELLAAQAKASQASSEFLARVGEFPRLPEIRKALEGQVEVGKAARALTKSTSTSRISVNLLRFGRRLSLTTPVRSMLAPSCSRKRWASSGSS